MDWSAILAPSVPVAEGVVRGTVVFLVVLLLMRVVGQREAGGLGITDVLLVVLVAQAAAPGLVGHSESVADGVVVVVTVLFWSVAVDALAYRFPWAARVLKARPRPLVRDGRLNQRALRRELMTRDEVMSQLRLHGIEDLREVARADIEPNGMISIVRADHGDTEPVEPPEKP